LCSFQPGEAEAGKGEDALEEYWLFPSQGGESQAIPPRTPGIWRGGWRLHWGPGEFLCQALGLIGVEKDPGKDLALTFPQPLLGSRWLAEFYAPYCFHSPCGARRQDDNEQQETPCLRGRHTIFLFIL